MNEQIKSIIESSELLKKYLSYPKEELQIMRLYIYFNLINLKKQTDEQKEKNIIEFRAVKSCLVENYNYMTYILNCKYNIDTNTATQIHEKEISAEYNLCKECSCKKCIKTLMTNFMLEINKINSEKSLNIKYIDVIDFMLDRQSPEFKFMPNYEFFNSVELIDLMKVQVILEADLVKLKKYDEVSGEAEFIYLDITSKNVMYNYYINEIVGFYKDEKYYKSINLNIKDKASVFESEASNLSENVYKIAAYYKYLIEIEKIDIIAALRRMLESENTKNGIQIRSNYFIYRYFNRVNELPYSQEVKDKIINLFNYLMNFNFKNSTPYVPINIMIYSNDKEGVQNIQDLIGEFMWYFNYMPRNMKYYDEFMNNIILDKYMISNLYYEKTKDSRTPKTGVLLIHNFESILYTDTVNQNLILNILTDEMEKNSRRVCTIIYGNKETLSSILNKYTKLSKLLINIELDIDELSIESVYNILVEKLKETENVTDDVKDKLLNYIKSTYYHSENKDMEYVKKLYNQIILNQNKIYKYNVRNTLALDNIPNAYNVRDLDTIMKELNELVGLTEIKNQINDLVYLLKFNQKAHINISKFNLHMVFTGNPGTGKTTVARLISDILFNLGYINQNKLTEVTSKDLIAEYVGQTSGKTFNIIKSALGGVLFIDEAYAITGGGSVNFGDECISTILKAMEDYRDNLVIIFAGYKEEMLKFIRSNVGLASRIGYTIGFDDYSVEELMKIFLGLLVKNNLSITEEAKDGVEDIIIESSKIANFGNARYINNLFQKILIEHAKNVDIDGEESKLYEITINDIKNCNLIANDSNKRKIGFN
jgi:Holliday junction resolvasome RuvABC ATP-dependent DNA helicase subunit